MMTFTLMHSSSSECSMSRRSRSTGHRNLMSNVNYPQRLVDLSPPCHSTRLDVMVNALHAACQSGSTACFHLGLQLSQLERLYLADEPSFAPPAHRQDPYAIVAIPSLRAQAMEVLP